MLRYMTFYCTRADSWCNVIRSCKIFLLPQLLDVMLQALLLYFRRWTNEIKPLLYCRQPPHPQISMLSLACALGSSGQKIKPWTQRKLDTVLFNIEICGVGFYFVAVCRVWFFCPSTVSCCYFLQKISANGTYTGSLAQDILYRYPCKGIAHSSFYRDPVKEILRTILYSSQRELEEDTLVFVSRSLQLVSLAGIIRMVCRTSPPSHFITVCRKNSRICRKWANCLWSCWWWWWWRRNKGNKGL